MNPPGDERFNPFPGLRPFQMEEEYLFFGRETQRQELVGLLREQRFIAVVGASGSHWQIAIMRPGGHPIAKLAQALLATELWGAPESPETNQLNLEATLLRSGLGLVEAVRQSKMAATENLLVVVDQFEELFRFNQSQSERSTRDEAGAFVNLLLEATRQEASSIYVVITMRSDFFGDCAQFEDLPDAINKGEYLVPRMNRDQKKAAIEGPVKVGGGEIAARLVQRLLNDVGDDPDQLPILQHALMRTWDLWQADHHSGEPLELRHYEAIGAMREALSQHADEVYQELADDRYRHLAEKLFKALTERGPDNRGVRRPTRLSELCGIVQGTEAELVQVIEAYRRSGRTFLMPPEGVTLQNQTVVDISHESLMRVWRRLGQWVEDEAQSARIYRRLAETALLWKDNKAGLYRDPDLQIALSWQERNHPTAFWAGRYYEGFDTATEFLAESRKARDADREWLETSRRKELEQARALAEGERLRAEQQATAGHRLKWMVRGLGLVAMIAVLALVMALTARRQAEINAKDAKQQTSLARQQKQQTQTAYEQVAETMGQLALQKAEQLLSEGRSHEALTYFASLLRQNPANQIVANRAISLLSERNFPLSETRDLPHPDEVQSAQFNSDGTRLLTVAHDQAGGFGTVRIWEVETGNLLGEFKHQSPVDSAEISPDGTLLVTSFSDSKLVHSVIRAWDVPTKTALAESSGGGFLSPVQFSPDSQRVVFSRGAYFMGAFVPIWEPRNRGRVREIKGVSPPLWPRFSPNGKWIATSGPATRIYEAETGKEMPGPLAQESWVHWTFKFSPDSLHLATYRNNHTNQSGEVRIWDVKTATLQREFKHAEIVGAAEFSPDSERLVTVANDFTARLGAVRIWNLRTGQMLAQLKNEGLVESVQFSPDGGRLLSQYANKTMRLWDAWTGQMLVEPWSQAIEATSVRFNAAGSRVLTASIGRGQRRATVQSWDITPGRQLHEPWTQAGRVISAQFDQGGDHLLIASLHASVFRGVAQIWDARTKQLIQEVAAEGPGFFAEFDAKGTRMVTLSLTQPARVSEARTGKLLVELKGTDGATSVRINSDASRLAAVSSRFNSGDSVLRILDLSTGEKLWEASRPGDMSRVQFNPDASRVAAVINDLNGRTGLAAVWEMSTQFLTELRHEAMVNSVQFSPDGLRVATASQDKTARIWNGRTGQPLTEPLRHSENVALAQFNPDGMRLATAAGGAVRIWDAQSGQPKSQSLNHQQQVRFAQFSPDGLILATGSGDMLQLWDLRTGQALTEPRKHEGLIALLGFSPDGQRVVTAVNDLAASVSFVRIWDVQPSPVPVPPWFPELLESVTGQRLSGDGNLEAVRTESAVSWEQQPRGLASTPSEFFQGWTKWFLADRQTRPIALGSTIAVPEYLAKRARENSLVSLREAVAYSATNFVPMAGIARNVMRQERSLNDRTTLEADWYSRRAVHLAPESAEAWWSRSEFLGQQERWPEAVTAVDKALIRRADLPEYWHTKGLISEGAKQLEPAAEAYSRAIALVPGSDSGNIEKRYEYLSRRLQVWKKLNRKADAARDFGELRAIPKRASQSRSNLIDLSSHFTGSLTDSLAFGKKNVLADPYQGDELSQLLPERTLKGTEFDIRGIIEMASTGLLVAQGAPERIEGIRIGMRCQRLNFLQGAMWGTSELDGTSIARYVVHYSNGEKREIPIVYGEQVRDWFTVPREPLGATKAVVAWTGTNLRSVREGMKLRLFKFTWENPVPDSEIVSIDVISEMARCSLLLIAITAE
jgi:WD40 repeat protein/tetratricopeptide (TPR) repeat protein